MEPRQRLGPRRDTPSESVVKTEPPTVWLRRGSQGWEPIAQGGRLFSERCRPLARGSGKSRCI